MQYSPLHELGETHRLVIKAGVLSENDGVCQSSMSFGGKIWLLLTHFWGDCSLCGSRHGHDLPTSLRAFQDGIALSQPVPVLAKTLEKG